LTNFCGATIPLIQTVFSQLIKLFPTEKWISAVRKSCLAIYSIERDSKNTLALENWETAVKYWLDFKGDDELNVNISIGQIYYEIGTIYFDQLRDGSKARENFDLSINYYQIAIEKGLTSFEEIKIYELLHEMYQKKFLIVRLDPAANNNKNEEKEIRLMSIKYLELHLESMFKCYLINDERIDMSVEQLTDYYDQFDMYDDKLSLLEKLLGLYQKDGIVKNSQKITELFQRIISIYVVDKTDPDTAVIYQSLLEEHTRGEDTKAADDFIIDYRQNGKEEVDVANAPLPRRRWSTVD
jgi:hypothetical protein